MLFPIPFCIQLSGGVRFFRTTGAAMESGNVKKSKRTYREWILLAV